MVTVNYNELSQQEDSDGTIKSITITRETMPDGSILRLKETLLTSGRTIVEEKILSGPLNSGIRFLPAAPTLLIPSTDVILPLYYHRLPNTKSESSFFRTVPETLCPVAVSILLLLLLFQVTLWYLIRTGQDIDTVFDVFREFSSKNWKSKSYRTKNNQKRFSSWNVSFLEDAFIDKSLDDDFVL